MHYIHTVSISYQKHICSFFILCPIYIQATSRFPTGCPNVKKSVEKPNLRSLIKLYENKIPAFGHVKEVKELLFEWAHQPLKRSIKRKKDDRPHIFAVEQCVGNYGQFRLAALIRADLKSSSTAWRGIGQMLFQ